MAGPHRQLGSLKSLQECRTSLKLQAAPLPPIAAKKTSEGAVIIYGRGWGGVLPIQPIPSHIDNNQLEHSTGRITVEP